MSEKLIELRTLPGISRVIDLYAKPDCWDYPNSIETMAIVNEASAGLFAITHDDTLADEETVFLSDEGDEPFTLEEYEERFNATRAAWPEARTFFEAIGWDLSDGRGSQLICAPLFERQIIAVAFDLVDGAAFTPDGSGSWSGYDSDEPEDEEAMAERLEREVAAFLTSKGRRA